MKRHNIINAAIALLSVVTLNNMLTSCDHKDVYLPLTGERHVELTFNWSGIEKGDSIPGGMTFYFYDLDNENYRKYDIEVVRNKTYRFAIPVGDIHLVCYNNDYQTPLARSSENVVMIPVGTNSYDTNGLLFSDGNCNTPQIYGLASIYPDNGDTLQHVVVKPTCLNRHATLTINDPKEALGRAMPVNATLSGVTDGRTIVGYLHPAEAKEQTVGTQVVTVNSKTSTADFRFMGFYMENGVSTNYVTVGILNADGTMTYRQFDVSSQVKAQQGLHKVSLSIDISKGKLVEPGD